MLGTDTTEMGQENEIQRIGIMDLDYQLPASHISLYEPSQPL
jgi:hypothetical protein